MGFLNLKEEFAKILHPYEDEDEEFYTQDNKDNASHSPKRELKQQKQKGGSASNVVSINTTTQFKVVLETPKVFNDAADIADKLKSGFVVVLNLEDTSKDIARRVIDFVAGVAYSSDGKIKKISINTYLVTPYSVDIVGDVLDELEGSSTFPLDRF